MEAVLTVARNFGLVRLAVLASVILGVASGFFYFVSIITKPEMSLLYSNLDLSDANKIVSSIESQGVPFEIKGGGSQIFVPVENVARLRMEMAEQGMPHGASVGYEIFDREEPLGASGFMQNINHLRALEGELARTIASLIQVSAARVHLVLPKRELFSRDTEQPSAAIVIKLNGSGRLPSNKVKAIQNLVSASVPRLTPERVSIIDDQGNLLASIESQNDSLSASNLDEMRVSYESRMSQTIVHLLEKYVGVGKVTAEVHADLDMNRVVENNETYDPDGQVIRSKQSVEEGENSSEAAQNAVTVANEVPNPAGAGADGKSSTQSKRNEEVTNYEISKKVTSHTKELGGIKRLSVAVLVDGVYKKEGEKSEYKPRSQEEMDKIVKLVQSAMGFDEKRGDSLEIQNMQFAQISFDEGTAENSVFLGLSRPEIIRLVELGLIAITALLILFLVVKPTLNKILTAIPAADAPLMKDAVMVNDKLQQEGSPEALSGPESMQSTVMIGRVEGGVNAASFEAINKLVEEKPEESVDILRGWMSESVT
ncbi:MAG: flagellar M-ring protein FliF [Alphaproteobacteria bacterium]|nr:flagellar M-ring protein FliF [Alphaproteobacteria bacterium]